MTRAILSPSTAVPTQRNRRLLLTLPAAVALPSLITACGGGADLSYDTEQALYFVDEAITPNKPQPAPPNPPPPGHTAPKFTVFPALPAGLTLNAQTGVISGTPTKLKRQGSHLIVACNNKGAAETCVRITVTGRGSWRAAAPAPGARAFASISPLPGGKFLVAGGLTTEGSADSAQIYDPSMAAWSSAAPMPKACQYHKAVVLRDERVMVLGGVHRNDGLTPIVTMLYDPVANSWTVPNQMNQPRFLCSAHLLPSGQVLVVGGVDVSNATLDTAELYDPVRGDWTVLPTRLSTPRADHAAALLADGKTLLLAGGRGVDTAELFKVDGSAPKVIPYGVYDVSHRAVKLDDGSVLVTTNESGQSKRYHPATSTWTTSSTVNAQHPDSTVVVLADGRVLRVGWSLQLAEIYNPDVNRWTAAAPMITPRAATVAALLGDGSVLVSGGLSGSGITSASERYLP